MANTFQLRIVTPRAELLDEQVREATAPGTLGEFGVLPNHVTFLTSLEPGVLTYTTDSGTRKVAVRGGFAEVLDNVMTVLADDAAFAHDVNVEAARDELRRTEALLETLSPADETYAATDNARRWAQARIDATR